MNSTYPWRNLMGRAARPDHAPDESRSPDVAPAMPAVILGTRCGPGQFRRVMRH
jgi:hypothetical protein